MAHDISSMAQQQSAPQGEIVLYQPDETIRLEVRLENDTVWLNRQQLAQLFGRDVKTIGKHINNALKEELRNVSTVAKFAIVQMEGNREISQFGRICNPAAPSIRTCSPLGALQMLILDASGLQIRSNRNLWE